MQAEHPSFVSPNTLGGFITALASLCIAVAIPAGAAPNATQLEIRPGASGNTEPAHALFWTSVPGAGYRIQERATVNPATPWTTVEVAWAVSNSMRWDVIGSSRDSRFYRLLLPEPEIFRIEPTVGFVAGGTTLHVVGQCLGANGEVRIGGVTVPAEPVTEDTLFRCEVPPLAEGVYDVEWLAGGQVVARRDKVYSVGVPAGQALQRLREPPAEPPASPTRGRVRGHVTVLKHHNTDPGQTGAPQATRGRARGHVTVLKGHESGPDAAGGMGAHARSVSLMPATGELQLEETDLVLPGVGLDFAFVRTYRSRTGPTTPMGAGWDHSHNLFIEADGHNVAVHDGTGRRDVFFQQADGTYSRDEFFCEGRFDDVSGNFILEFADTGRWEFFNFGVRPAGGKIARIVDRNGNTMEFAYDAQARLRTVTDTLGRVYTLDYDAVGRLTSVSDFTGRTVRYEHDAEGNLVACISPEVTGTPNGNDFPGGKTNRFAYSRGFSDDRLNHNLTSITDPKGQTWLEVVYRTNTDPATVAFDTMDYVQRGPYRTKLRRGPQTPSPANGFAVAKGIVNDGAGNVIELFYDSLNRCVRQLEYTGRANPELPTNENQNRPVNKLRAEDPDYFETVFEWNADSLCTRIRHPRGNETRFVHEREFAPGASPRKKGDLRVLREMACCGGADFDGDGSADITERAWRFAHDPRFGTSRSASATTNYYPIVLKEVTIVGLAAPGGGSGGPFVTALADPRGTVTTASYDDHGNLAHGETLERKSGAVIACDFEYNPRGQRTATIHPADAEGRRRRDEFNYHTSGPQAGYLATTTLDATGLAITDRHEYDALGRLARHIDPRGFDQLWTHNALDQVVGRQTQQSSFGTLVRYATFFTYDANDNLVQVDRENRDEKGALDPINPIWSTWADYDTLDRLISVAQENRVSATFFAVSNRFVYDANGNLTRHLLPESASGADSNNVVACLFDERDLLFLSVAAPGTGLGATNRFDYDANGNCRRVSKIDAFTVKQTVMDFDGFDRCMRVTDALGNVETFAWDANDNLTYDRFDGETNDVAGSAGNRRLHEARYEYDGMDRLVRRIGSFFDVFTQLPIDDGASIARFSYAPNGQLTREMDDNGHSTVYRYDSAGRLSGVARGLLEAGPFEEGVQLLAFTCDGNGNVLTETQTDRSDLGGTQSFVTTYAYDGLGRLVRRADNLGNTNAFAYDSRDNCVSEIDPTGNETVRAFDGLNRCVQTTSYEGMSRTVTISTSHVEYQDRRCVSTTDGNGNTTAYAYDSLDRHIRTTHSDGTAMSLVWSPRSNLERLTDANGTVVAFTYDLLDRCVRKDIKPGPGVAATTTFEAFAYDGRSNLVFATNDTSMLEFAYSCGPSKEEIEAREKAKADCIAAAARHDGEGNRVSLTYPDDREVRYAYDSLNRVTNVSQMVGGRVSQLASYAYDGPGRVARIARANGINTRINWNGLQEPANSSGDFGWQTVARINHARGGASPAIIDQRVFAYDRAQNKTLRAQTSPFVQGGPLTTNAFAYDKLHRLTRATRTRGADVESDNTYVLDAMGNRTNVIGLGGVGVYGMDPTLPEPGDFQMNQYTFTPFGAHQYDRNGNVVFIDGPTGGTRHHYDYADRLVHVERAAGPAFAPVVSFTYDPLGRRITKTTYPPPPEAPMTTRYYHDLDSDGDDILEFQEGGVTAASFVLPEVDDEVLVAFTGGGAAIYFHQDDLGNVLALTDDKGNVLERYDYDDYGAPSFLDEKGGPLTGTDGLPVTASPLGNPFLFHGMFWDAETGLYLAKRDGTPVIEWTFEKGWPASYVDPHTGRHMGRMKIDGGMPNRISMGSNSRALSGNNPWSPRAAGGRGSKSDVYVWKLAGGGGGGGGCAGAIEVMFNPREYTISKSTPWRSREDVGVWRIKGRAKQDVYVWKLKKEEGGRHTPFHNKYRPQFYFRTTDVTGEIELESGREMVAEIGPDYVTKKRPGRVKYANIVLKRGYVTSNLIVPIAMDKGLRFAIREGGRTVGAGQVTDIVK